MIPSNHWWWRILSWIPLPFFVVGLIIVGLTLPFTREFREGDYYL